MVPSSKLSYGPSREMFWMGKPCGTTPCAAEGPSGPGRRCPRCCGHYRHRAAAGNYSSRRPPRAPTSCRAKMAAAAERVVAVAPPGYTALAVKFGERQRSPHCLLVKEHQVREGAGTTHPARRTLFVLNVPPYCSRDSLVRLFSRCGHVQSVYLCDKPELGEKKEKSTSKFFNRKTLTGFHVAYVVFRKPAGVQAAKALSQEGPLLISTESHPVKTGISKWIASYAASVVDPEELKAEVDAYMQDYDKKIAEEEAKAAQEEGVPDEEGWVKVTRKGRKPGLPRTEAASLRVLEKEKQKRARKELLNFYAWQHRETKREHIAQLRKKFEEDKQRIALMRAQRKFRPY